MRRIISLLFIFFLMDSPGAQKHLIAINAGMSIPVGSFSKRELTYFSSRDGYAALGSFLSGTYNYIPKQSSFGVSASLRERSNKLNSKNVFDNNDIQHTWTKEEGPYKVYAFMAGTVFTSPLTKTCGLQLQLLSGVAKARLPKLSWQADENNKHIKFDRSAGTTYTYSSCFSAGINIKLVRRLFLLANIDYWYLKPDFKNITQSYLEWAGNTGTGGYATYTWSAEMTTLNASLGIQLHLGR